MHDLEPILFGLLPALAILAAVACWQLFGAPPRQPGETVLRLLIRLDAAGGPLAYPELEGWEAEIAQALEDGLVVGDSYYDSGFMLTGRARRVLASLRRGQAAPAASAPVAGGAMARRPHGAGGE